MINFDPVAYWEDRLSRNLGLHGVGFLGLGKSYNKWLYRVRQKVFLRALRLSRTSLSSAHVLDVGSGTGFCIELWEGVGVQKISGCDLTKTAVSYLQKNFPAHDFHLMDIGSQLSHVERYDAISAFDVFLHIVDDARFEKAIQNLFTLLRPGGLLLFSDNFLHAGRKQLEAHALMRSLHEIEEIVTQAGFEIVSRKPAFVLMNQPIDSKSRLRKLFWAVLTQVVRRSEFAGHVIGAGLYPVEVLLTSILNESPSTEVMVCRKPAGLPASA